MKDKKRNLLCLIVSVFIFSGCFSAKTGSLKSFNALEQPDQMNVNSKACAHYLRGLLYERQGSLDRAVSEFSKAHNYDQDSTAVLTKLAASYFRKGEFPHAIGALKKVFVLEPENIKARLLLAIIYTHMARFEDASLLYKEVIELDPENKHALLSIADLYVFEKKTEKAILIYEQIVIKEQPQHAFIYFNLGMLYLQIGKYDEAVRCLEQALHLKSDYVEAYLCIGLVYELKDEIGKSEQAYKSVINIMPKNCLAHFRLGSLYLGTDQDEKALQQFQRVIEINPEIVEPYFEIARTYLKLDNPDAAIKILLSRENFIKEKAYFFLLLGIANSVKDDFVLAEQYYHKALTEKPDYEAARFYLAVLYERQGKRDLSKQEFLLIIENNPDNSVACNYLGYMYAEDGANLDKAIELIKKAIKIEPKNGAYVDSLGWAYYKKGNLEYALKYLEQAVSLLDSDFEIHSHLGQVYFEKGCFSKARKHWERSLKIKPAQVEVKEKLENLIANNGKRGGKQ
ncbi:MAG: hypothetical protein DRP78_02965 [Candidatus Omnitrophota bacterium]|nr:MAG: hypothetical protein DRP78_02965 [Candidatus Omnitrophota bacterium]